MSEFQKVGDLPQSLGARLQYAEGACESHGQSRVLVRAGLGWYCPKCLDQQKRPEFDSQWAKLRLDDLIRVADIPVRFRGQSFKGGTPEKGAIRAIAASFRDFISGAPRWASLLLAGGNGTGKTLLACEFAEAFIRKTGRSARYITARGMISEIQSSYGAEGKSEASEIDRFAQYDLLILDEIDAISGKENAQLLLTEVINRRYSNNRPVIAITNQKLEAPQERRADRAAERVYVLRDFVGDRVYDRLRENGFPCNFGWASQRAFA
jgi:DNA replication protein DnaC